MRETREREREEEIERAVKRERLVRRETSAVIVVIFCGPDGFLNQQICGYFSCKTFVFSKWLFEFMNEHLQLNLWRLFVTQS